MPIYEYYCADCDKVIEKLVKSARDEEVSCPDCGKEKLKKIHSTFSSCSLQGGAYSPPPGGC